MLKGRWWKSSLLVAGMTFCATQACAQGEGKTLRDVLTGEHLPFDAVTLHNLDKTITSGAELNDTAQFVIAYFVSDSTGAAQSADIH